MFTSDLLLLVTFSDVFSIDVSPGVQYTVITSTNTGNEFGITNNKIVNVEIKFRTQTFIVVMFSDLQLTITAWSLGFICIHPLSYFVTFRS